MNNIYIKAIVEFVLPICAIIVSIYTWKKTEKITKGINRNELNKDFFKEIFFDIIIKDFPQAINKIISPGVTNLDSYEEANKLIYQILDGAQFYKYFNKEFYNKIKRNLIDIDDVLTLLSNTNNNQYQTEEYINRIKISVNNFYNNLKDYYYEI